MTNNEPASSKQLAFVYSLVRNYLDFLLDFQSTENDVVHFLNEEYGAWLSSPINKLSDLQSFEASEIIARLRDGEV